MRYFFFSVLFVLLFASAQAQFGLSASYLSQRAPDWQFRDAVSGAVLADPPGTGFSIGADYWFRMKKVRIEFLPELNYAQTSATAYDLETRSRWYSLFFNVNFYPFDFKGDCDCPTFSKQNDFLAKGFFLQVSPGISYLDNRAGSNPELRSTATALSAGLAAGLDIGVSDLLTISPVIGLRYFPNAEWDSLPAALSDPNFPLAPVATESSATRLWAGLRLGWRVNYRR